MEEIAELYEGNRPGQQAKTHLPLKSKKKKSGQKHGRSYYNMSK